jgi:hypothetical protein
MSFFQAHSSGWQNLVVLFCSPACPRTHYVAQSSLKLMILLPQLPSAGFTAGYHHVQLPEFSSFLLLVIQGSLFFQRQPELLLWDTSSVFKPATAHHVCIILIPTFDFNLLLY